MQLTSVSSLSKRPSADAIVLPFWNKDKKAAPASGMKEFSSLYAPVVHLGDFRGNEGETVILYHARHKEKRVILLGLGKENKATGETFRRAYASAVKVCLRKKLHAVNFLLPEECDFEAAAEGVALANYAFDKLKNDLLKEDPTRLIVKATFITPGRDQKAACKKVSVLASSIHFVRDLVNSNADDKAPLKLGEIAQGLHEEYSALKVTVFDKRRLEREKMGLLLAVGRGSAVDPAFILLEYNGAPGKKEKTAIIGKGITFDTGGLNLKPTGGIETMKCDMAGAATVLGTLRAAAALKLKVNLIGAIATTENAIGPKSYKPGDVYTSYSGKTVEITNTDAEGRLVLADALAYVEKNCAPTRMIDLATLTGAIMIALGEEATGLFSNDDKLAHALVAAGEKTQERLWRMPLYPEYKDALKSPIADLKNSGSNRNAGSCRAAMFLQQFVKHTPWAHLDIAGTAYLGEPKLYHPTHATGVGVRLLIELLSQ